MDSGSTNVFKQLDERIDKLRSLGVERGLSATEIDDCILMCVDGEKNVKGSKTRKCSAPYSRRRQIFRIASGVCAGFWAFVAGVYFLSLVHEPTDQFLAKALQPMLYPFLKSVRLVGLPVLRRYSNLAVYYDEECLIANPYYTPTPAPCDMCETVNSVKREPYEDFKLDLKDASYNDPTILTGGFVPVSLPQLMDICRDHVQELTEGVHLIDSSSPRIKALAPFLNLTEEEARADQKFHLTWRTRMVGPARVLRSIYRRPSFINYQSEVALEKTILIDSPSAESYSVPLGKNPYAWYVQSSGHRRLMLMPKSECSSKCHSFQITMKPGEMLYLFTDPWSITSLPVIGGEDRPIDTSVAFMGMYTIE